MQEERLNDPTKVMVVFGRNLAARNAMFGFLRSLGLAPIEWEQAVAATGMASPHNSTAVGVAMASAQAIVVILTAEERAGLLPKLAGEYDLQQVRLGGQPRQNVTLEAGMAHALAPNRTILVELGAIRGASDFAGMNMVRMNNSADARAVLRQRLLTAGCAVDQTALDYLNPGASGDFDTATVRYVSPEERIVAAAGISRTPAHLEYFWCGPDLTVRYRWWEDPQGWSDVDVLDGPKAVSLSAVSARGDDELLFGLSPEGQVWYRSWERNDQGWLVAGSPRWIPGVVAGPIAAGRRDVERLEVLAFDDAGRPCHTYWRDGDGWSGWLFDWWRPSA